jgi:hypothetical protein
MRKRICVIPVLAALAGSAVVLEAQAPQLAMLDRLEKGSWEVKPRDDAESPIRICMASGRELIQLRHMRNACIRIVVQDSSQAATVQYSCPGNGYGRTQVRRETGRLVQIDTQGIEHGLPFAFAAEARWTGPCNR